MDNGIIIEQGTYDVSPLYSGHFRFTDAVEVINGR